MSDKIVARGSGIFDSPRIHQFGIESAEATFPVTFAMDIDNKDASDVEWMIQKTRLDGPGATVLEGLFRPGRSVASLLLQEGELYSLLVHNEPLERHHILIGAVDEDGPLEDDVAVLLPPTAFETRHPNSIYYNFAATTNSSLPEPTDRILTLELTFDDFPRETSWVLLVADEDDCDVLRGSETARSQFSRYSYGPVSSYGAHLARRSINETIPLPDVAPGFCRPVILIILDRFGNGIDEPQSYRIWNDAAELLASGDMRETIAKEIPVVVEGDVEESAQPPTVTPSSLSTTRPPTPTVIAQIRVFVETRASPPESLGWRIVDPASGNLWGEVLPGDHEDGTTGAIVFVPTKFPAILTGPMRLDLYSTFPSNLDVHYSIEFNGKTVVSGECQSSRRCIHDIAIDDQGELSSWSSVEISIKPAPMRMEMAAEDQDVGWTVHRLNATKVEPPVALGRNFPQGTDSVRASVLLQEGVLYGINIEGTFVQESSVTMLNNSSHAVVGDARANDGVRYLVVNGEDPVQTEEDDTKRIELQCQVCQGNVFWLMVSDFDAYLQGEVPILGFGPKVSFAGLGFVSPHDIRVPKDTAPLDLVIVGDFLNTTVSIHNDVNGTIEVVTSANTEMRGAQLIIYHIFPPWVDTGDEVTTNTSTDFPTLTPVSRDGDASVGFAEFYGWRWWVAASLVSTILS